MNKLPPSLPVESHEVLRQALEEVGPKEVAAALNLSISLVYKWMQPSEDDGSGAINPLDRVLQVHKVTKSDAMIQWLCRKAGGFFVKNPRADKGDFQLMPATQKIVMQFAEMLAEISQAAVDHQVTDKEASKIRHEWDELKRYTEGFVRCCEAGDFAGIEGLERDFRAKH